MSGINDCPRCGADMVLPERVCLICLTHDHTRLVAACRKLGVTAPGDLRHWSTIPDVIAEFDAALDACEVKP